MDFKQSTLALVLFFTMTLLTACGSSDDDSSSDVFANTDISTDTTNQTEQGNTIPEYPKGIYCSCGPTNATNSSITSSLGVIDYLDGVLVRINWADIQPATTTYNWALLDDQLALAEQYDLEVVLAIMNGPFAPDWLESKGVVFFDYPFRDITQSLPLPWDETYLSEYSAFIAALGERYTDEERIRLIHITNATTNGLEMQYVFNTATMNQFIAAGYTETKVIESWQTVIDAYASAFPNHLLDLDVHPVFNSNTIAESVVDYGHTNLGNRFGVFSAWWSVHNATNVYPAMFDLLTEASEASFASVQMVGSTSTGLNPLTQQELFDALQLAIDSDINYVEVWNNDITSTPLNTSLSGYDAQMEQAN